MSTNDTLPIAVQMYSLRSLTDSLDEVLAKVAAIGYPGIETVGDHGISAEAMNVLLDKHGLKIVSTHVSLNVLQEDLDSAIAFNKAVGNDVIIVPALPEELRVATADNWTSVGRMLDGIGAQCAAAKMRLLYHNHWWEMDEIDGKLAIDWLLESSSPENVGFEPDLAWIVRGGADPIELLAKYSGRYPRVHAKDLAKPGESDNRMDLADVGHGTLDRDVLLPAAKGGGAEWFVVEHDLPSVPLQGVARSYEFLKRRLG